MINEDTSIVKTVELLEVIISLRSDGIVHVHFKKNTIFDLHLLSELRKTYAEITEGKKSKFLFTSDQGFTLTKEAREFAKINADPNIGAFALEADNLAYRIIGNFVLKVNKPKVPYRLFANTNKALQWLTRLP